MRQHQALTFPDSQQDIKAVSWSTLNLLCYEGSEPDAEHKLTKATDILNTWSFFGVLNNLVFSKVRALRALTNPGDTFSFFSFFLLLSARSARVDD